MNASDCRVHLSTFHGSKGLEFDRVFVLPCPVHCGGSLERGAEERRAYYVAMTRAREELVVATLGAASDLAFEVECDEVDLREHAGRQRSVPAVYFDCTPADVRLTSSELARSQGAISRLREGDGLQVDDRGSRVRLRAGGRLVAELSAAGQDKLDARLRRWSTRRLSARVHEVYQHLLRSPSGEVRRTTLVVLPTLVAVG